jgi:hypothetical protein
MKISMTSYLYTEEASFQINDDDDDDAKPHNPPNRMTHSALS